MIWTRTEIKPGEILFNTERKRITIYPQDQIFWEGVVEVHNGEYLFPEEALATLPEDASLPNRGFDSLGFVIAGLPFATFDARAMVGHREALLDAEGRVEYVGVDTRNGDPYGSEDANGRIYVQLYRPKLAEDIQMSMHSVFRYGEALWMHTMEGVNTTLPYVTPSCGFPIQYQGEMSFQIGSPRLGEWGFLSLYVYNADVELYRSSESVRCSYPTAKRFFSLERTDA